MCVATNVEGILYLLLRSSIYFSKLCSFRVLVSAAALLPFISLLCHFGLTLRMIQFIVVAAASTVWQLIIDEGKLWPFVPFVVTRIIILGLSVYPIYF